MARRQKLTMDRAAEYLITVEGLLDPEWKDWFSGMSIESHLVEGNPVTYLSGSVQDQAALHGMLRNLYALRMPLLGVRLSSQP